MEFRRKAARPLTERELDAIAGGRVCDQTGPKIEASMQFGSLTLVIWATAGCHDVYWKVP
jgi:hypothetical protein